MTEVPTYSRTQIIKALVANYEWYIHDNYDEHYDNNPDNYRESVVNMSDSELIEETGTDDGYTLEDFMSSWS